MANEYARRLVQGIEQPGRKKKLMNADAECDRMPYDHETHDMDMGKRKCEIVAGDVQKGTAGKKGY